jgi:hypothetical protein
VLVGGGVIVVGVCVCCVCVCCVCICCVCVCCVCSVCVCICCACVCCACVGFVVVSVGVYGGIVGFGGVDDGEGFVLSFVGSVGGRAKVKA